MSGFKGTKLAADKVIKIGSRLEFYPEEASEGVSSRVEEIKNGKILAAMPMNEKGVPIIPRPGEAMMGKTPGDGCFYKFSTHYLDKAREGNIPVWIVTIPLAEARKIQADYEVGEDVSEKVDFNKFGRRAILNLRQTLASKILELEHDSLYNKYKDRVGQVISGEVYQVWKREVLIVDDENNELILPKSEQIPADVYRKGETVRAVILRVDNENNNPKIILSRTAPIFLQRLLEAEVPEINDGLIAIRRIARMPGERAKIAVESFDERIDPVGACVGVKGSRVHGIVRELCNENLDVINYSSNIKLFIQRALAPAQITSVNIDEENHKAEVYLQPEEVSLAIGRGGMNIKLASMLTEYTIDVFREINEADADEDIYLDEFSDEIDQWVIDAIKGIGLDTAKQVLKAPRNMLIEKADLEEETVDSVLKVLRAEFEN